MDNKKVKNMDPYSGSAGIIEINPEMRNIGYADGINVKGPLRDKEKSVMIQKAAVKFGEFLDDFGCDWKYDTNSKETPTRVAKAYVNDLWSGRYNAIPDITTFPNLEYDGIIFQGNIPLISMCSHHHQTIMGKVHVAYIPKLNQEIIGLSKINRIVEHYARRGAIQENLTVRIHDSISRIIDSNKGVAVMIEATHNCVQCRGVGHTGTKMKTSKLTGDFMQSGKTRNEFYDFIKELKQMSDIAIIGSGFSGLSAAAILAQKGHSVTVYEKNTELGGRARQFKAKGYTFDMGPSWYWMPDVFERFFSRFNKKASDYYELKKLDPGFQIIYDEQNTMSIPADWQSIQELFEEFEKGSGE